MELNTAVNLSISDLRYKYPGAAAEVLKGITCTINAGEKVAVLGTNGAGKTTLFNLITGLTSGYSGSVKLCGTELNKIDRREIAHKMALVPQKHEPMFPFLVRDFIMMGRYSRLGVLGIPHTEDIQVVEKAAAETGADRFLDRPYSTLSGGEMQLAVIARALAQESEILILDEPNTHLDFKNQFVVLDLVHRISQKRNMTLLMSLHNPNDVVQFADRAIVIHNGVIAADGKPSEIVNEQLLADIFGIRALSVKCGDNCVFIPQSLK